jgi:hypothetical protein
MKPKPTMGSFHKRTDRVSCIAAADLCFPEIAAGWLRGFGPQAGKKFFVNKSGFLRSKQASGHEKAGKDR